MRSLQPIFTLAALNGSVSVVKGVVSNPTNIIPSDFTMPLFDREKMRLVILEYNRLHPAVKQSAIVLGKDESMPPQCPFAIPKGSPITINFALHGRDPSRWENPDIFDPYERNLWGKDSEYTMFNGVGNEGPRICPGRDLALEVCITGVKTLLETGVKHPIMHSDLQRVFNKIVGSVDAIRAKYLSKVSDSALAWKNLSFTVVDQTGDEDKKAAAKSAASVTNVCAKNLNRETFKSGGFTFFSHAGKYACHMPIL